MVTQQKEKECGEMAYIFKNGKRYYQDEKTGNVVLKRLPSAKGIVKASEAFDDFFRK